jgi:Leucine-rich repeat (LRR) protein
MFFCEMDGGEWLENDMWLSDLHECDWYNRIGLDPCNRVEQIEILRMHDNGLQGTLPLELSIISTLFEFTISDNLISGTFPGEEFAKLTDLDTFVIAFNQFNGPVPGFLFRFPDMVYLDLAYNRFTGTLPDNIPETMPDLGILFMENNDIGGTIPTNLGTLKDLRKVHMDDNALTGKIPTEFGTPQRLQQLYLHGNKLTGGIPSELQTLGVLNEATFHYNDLEGSVDGEVCELMYAGQLKTISVDCETVACECCQCGDPFA